MNRLARLFLIAYLASLSLPSQAQLGNILKNLGSVTNAADIFQSFGGIPLEEELIIGGSVAVEIVARFGGILKDTNATQRVNLIGKSIARYCNRPELNYHFGILNSEEVNAFSAPGGYVFITKGLYDQTANDDQLAGILAHEIAHVTLRHALKIISRGKAFSAGIKIGVSTTAELNQFGQGIESLTQGLFKGFEAPTEYAADQEGRRIAQLTGFAPDGLKEVLHGLAEKESGSKKIFSTHPPAKSRIEKLDQSASKASEPPPKKPSRR